jgi:predicted enzyme related to lactoylglutathione lyase
MAENKIIHFEIVGPDQAALQRFYSGLFDWSINTDNPGGYGMTGPAETGIVIGVGSSQDGGAGHVTGYIRVADVDAILAKATELGGTVIMPKFSPDGTAQLGLLADPQGHVIGVTE